MLTPDSTLSGAVLPPQKAQYTISRPLREKHAPLSWHLNSTYPIFSVLNHDIFPHKSPSLTRLGGARRDGENRSAAVRSANTSWDGTYKMPVPPLFRHHRSATANNANQRTVKSQPGGISAGTATIVGSTSCTCRQRPTNTSALRRREICPPLAVGRLVLAVAS